MMILCINGHKTANSPRRNNGGPLGGRINIMIHKCMIWNSKHERMREGGQRTVVSAHQLPWHKINNVFSSMWVVDGSQ